MTINCVRFFSYINGFNNKGWKQLSFVIAGDVWAGVRRALTTSHRHKIKPEHVCLFNSVPCSGGSLSCQWLCDKMSYLVALVAPPPKHTYPPSVLNTLPPLSALENPATPLDGSSPYKRRCEGEKRRGAKEAEGGGEKKRDNSLSRTGSHANRTQPEKTPPRSENAQRRGLPLSPRPDWGLIF